MTSAPFPGARRWVGPRGQRARQGRKPAWLLRGPRTRVSSDDLPGRVWNMDRDALSMRPAVASVTCRWSRNGGPDGRTVYHPGTTEYRLRGAPRALRVWRQPQTRGT